MVPFKKTFFQRRNIMLNTNQEKKIPENHCGNILYKFYNLVRETNHYDFATYYDNGSQSCSSFRNNNSATNFAKGLIELMKTYENENGDIDIENLLKYLDQIIISWQSFLIDKKLYDENSKGLADEIKDYILNSDREHKDFIHKIRWLRSILKPDIMFEFEDNYLFFVTHKYDKIIEHAKENWMNYEHDYFGYKRQGYESYNDFHNHYSSIVYYDCKFLDQSSPFFRNFIHNFRPKNH